MKRLGKKYKSLKKDYANLLDNLYANPSEGVDLGMTKKSVLLYPRKKYLIC